jgi:hypothetical protein
MGVYLKTHICSFIQGHTSGILLSTPQRQLSSAMCFCADFQKSTFFLLYIASICLLGFVHCCPDLGSPCYFTPWCFSPSDVKTFITISISSISISLLQEQTSNCSAHCIPGAVFRVLQLCVRHYPFLHLTDEKTGAQEIKSLSKVI